MKSAGELLLEARLEAGLTQQQVADNAGLPQSAISAYESGKREPTVPTFTRLLTASRHDLSWSIALRIDVPERPFTGPVGRRVQRHRAELRELLAAEGFGNPQVFGSVSRNEDRPDSDFDLLVDLPPETGFFALWRLRERVEGITAVPTDLIPREGLKPRVATHIAKDLVTL